jgi:hypothetical protein
VPAFLVTPCYFDKPLLPGTYEYVVSRRLTGTDDTCKLQQDRRFHDELVAIGMPPTTIRYFLSLTASVIMVESTGRVGHV